MLDVKREQTSSKQREVEEKRKVLRSLYLTQRRQLMERRQSKMMAVDYYTQNKWVRKPQSHPNTKYNSPNSTHSRIRSAVQKR